MARLKLCDVMMLYGQDHLEKQGHSLLGAERDDVIQGYKSMHVRVIAAVLPLKIR